MAKSVAKIPDAMVEVDMPADASLSEMSTTCPRNFWSPAFNTTCVPSCQYSGTSDLLMRTPHSDEVPGACSLMMTSSSSSFEIGLLWMAVPGVRGPSSLQLQGLWNSLGSCGSMPGVQCSRQADQ